MPAEHVHPLVLAYHSVVEATPAELIGAAAAAGFDGVTVVVDPQLARDARTRADAAGLRIAGGSCGWLRDELDRTAMHAKLEALRVLSAPSARIVGWDTDRARIVANLAVLCDAAAGYGLRVSMEYAAFLGVRTAADARAVLDAVGRPNLDITVDALHLVRCGDTAASLACLPPERIGTFQICDGPLAPPPSGDLLGEALHGRSLPGEGAFPLRAILAALPPTIDVEVEVPISAQAGGSIALRARRCAETTRALLAKS
jgi:sugar phosphate isomerase/epimerase